MSTPTITRNKVANMDTALMFVLVAAATDQGMTITELGKRAGMTGNTRDALTTDDLERLCNVLELDPFDVCHRASDYLEGKRG